jgi:hypothetical protein
MPLSLKELRSDVRARGVEPEDGITNKGEWEPSVRSGIRSEEDRGIHSGW